MTVVGGTISSSSLSYSFSFTSFSIADGIEALGEWGEDLEAQ